jgi:hypothetical protein
MESSLYCAERGSLFTYTGFFLLSYLLYGIYNLSLSCYGILLLFFLILVVSVSHKLTLCFQGCGARSFCYVLDSVHCHIDLGDFNYLRSQTRSILLFDSSLFVVLSLWPSSTIITCRLET